MYRLVKKSEDNYQTKKDSVCLIDNKPITKGENAILIGEFAKGSRRAVSWRIAHPTATCNSKVAKWINEQNEKSTTATTATTATPVGNDALSMIVSKLVSLNEKLTKLEQEKTELKRHIDNQRNSIAGLQKIVRIGSSTKPERTPADENNKPVVCLGIKTDGTECKQTRVKANGYCAQHQGQSGDSEAEDLKQQADKKKEQELTTEQLEQLEQIGILEQL